MVLNTPCIKENRKRNLEGETEMGEVMFKIVQHGCLSFYVEEICSGDLKNHPCIPMSSLLYG